MIYPLSELIDRYSILLLKKERLPENKQILNEVKLFYRAITDFGVPFRSYRWINDLKAINGRIWDLESDIRKGNTLPLAEVGHRALLIRDINKDRIAYKNTIAKEMGEFMELKVDHASA